MKYLSLLLISLCLLKMGMASIPNCESTHDSMTTKCAFCDLGFVGKGGDGATYFESCVLPNCFQMSDSLTDKCFYCDNGYEGIGTTDQFDSCVVQNC